MAHRRIRLGPDGSCMAVRAGNQVFLRGQTGVALDGVLAGPGDPAAQARQAMRNVGVLLEEAGAQMAHVSRITAYVTDRAAFAPVDAVLAEHFGAAVPARAGVVVNGLARPELLVEIDVDAEIPP